MICVLQFDSASRPLLDRMAADGRLPNLTSLAARGSTLELETPAVDFAAGSFYSLYSGVELGDHGIFYPFQWSASEQRAVYASALEAPPAVWERLGAAGRRTLAIDPYESRPPAVADGVFVCGWGLADRVVLPRWSRPGSALRGFERSYGRAPDATETFGRPDPRELVALRETLVAAPGRVATLARRLLAEQRFDLCWLTFAAAHLAGHQFWDLTRLDPDTLGAGERDVLGRALEDVYGAVDSAIGDVVAALPAATDLIVVSPVGMERDASRADLLPEMLARVLAGGPPQAEGDGGEGAIWRLRAAVPAGVRRRAAAALPRRLALELTARLELRGHDWSTTAAFAHPADNQGYVRLNLAGRERDGVVDPGEAEALLDRVAAGLHEFRDADGRPAVAEVVRARELYPGAMAHRLPDLVVRWAPGTGAEVVSERHGTVRRRGAGTGRSGNHTPGGAWALVAPGDGELPDLGRPGRLVDVAATVCALAGVPADGLAGEPLLTPGVTGPNHAAPAGDPAPVRVESARSPA